ncbi:unnamed protein product [Pelagomonas calceolata]|uniref:Uncharacterized protein n=1 Tax=Pelagomonas calceolata TaxID=35677 RepID=A0A8J2SNE0_9STRA|nr:unnamed protein product [Pelagomonas calceolata]
MEAPTLVEVDDLSPAGSLETGSPSVYSDMGSPSTDGSPMEAAPAEKPVLLRASQEIPYVGLGAYAKRAAEAAARRRHQQRRPRYRTARPDAADDALRAFAGRAKRAASSDKPQQLDVLKVGALTQQNLHVSVALPTRTPSSGLPTGFSATSSEEESVAPVPTKVKRSVDSTTSPAPMKSVDTASSPAPWRSPQTSTLKSPGFASPPSLKSPAVTKQQKLVEDTKKSIKEAIALGDADALKARTPTDGPSNLIRDVEEAEERYRAKEWEFEMKRAEFNLDLPPGALAGNSEPAEPSAPPTTRSPAPTTRSPRPASPKRAASPRPREARVSTQSFGCQADEENVPYGQVIVPTADKLPASKRRARDLLARQEHAAKALRALADLENVDDDSDDGMGDEGLIFDENVGMAFLHVSDVTGVRPAADVAASAAEHDLIRRAQQGPETRSPKLRGDDASPMESFKMITPRGTLRERLEQMEAFADKLEVELDQGRERIEGFVEQMRQESPHRGELNPMVLPSPRSPPPPPPPKSLSSLASRSPPPPPLETASVERHALSNVQGAWGAYEELAAALDSPPPPKGPAHRTGTATARAGRRGGPRARRPPAAKRIGRDIW